MSETVIQVTSLGKRIKGKTILEDISFEINKGDCVALIGPNGAGRSFYQHHLAQLRQDSLLGPPQS